jgi:integrase
MHLGDFPETTVEVARKRCQGESGIAAQGINPQIARRAAKHEQTFKGLWAYWLADAKQRGVKTVAEDERRYRRFLAQWANRRLSAIHKSDVQSLFGRVTTENGRYAANRLLALVKSMFHKAPDMGFTGSDPTVGVKKHREVRRDRFLHAEELHGFFKALFAEPNETLRDLLLVALLTGARKSNVMAMAWVDVDFATSLWRIPETKSGKPVVVPLVPAAVAILRHRRETSDGSPWVFSSSRSTTGHITEIKSAWKRVKTAAALVDCRPHDLRRSLASHMAIGGTSLPIVGAMLGHSQPSTTAIYARLSTDPVRTAAETAATAILTFGKASVGASGMIIDVPSSQRGT